MPRMLDLIIIGAGHAGLSASQRATAASVCSTMRSSPTTTRRDIPRPKPAGGSLSTTALGASRIGPSVMARRSSSTPGRQRPFEVKGILGWDVPHRSSPFAASNGRVWGLDAAEAFRYIELAWA